MQRREATALLKELISDGLVVPSLVALKESKPGKFDLLLNGDCDIKALTKFLAEKNLIVREDEKGFWLISSP